MMRVAIMLAATIAASSAAAAPKQVAGGSQLVTAVSNCRQIQNNASRLACFDRTVDALAAADARGDVNVVDRQSMREVRRSLFGFSIPKLPFFSNSKDKEMKDEPKILETTLLSFRSLGNDFYRFSIKDPESTWDTIDAAYIGTPKPGDKVVIKKGGLGNYFVQFGREREISAKRVR